ncbi:MAG TPA: HAMP domain-containing sensor histidine kinase, partial [Casimicrobiaceae bacterium]|nr:HAMP domain-containing sensor histidine kinase [Casimicrobiaceae bacterium]
NVGAYVGVSVLTRQTVAEQAQAARFVDAMRRGNDAAEIHAWKGTASLPELRALLGRFLGGERADAALAAYAARRGFPSAAALPGDAGLVQFAERELAGAIGGASARIMVASAVREDELSVDELRSMLDEASQAIAYSHELEKKSRELVAATQELQAANERLREFDRLKDDFVSTVTHELRTPLTAIRASTEILHDNPDLDAGERQRFLATILTESERLTRLINQVLDLAKLESGRAEWRVSRVDLKSIVEDSLGATQQLFHRRNVAVEARLPERVPAVDGDRDRLVQVLINLLSNAAKFVRPGEGKVTVELCARDGALRVAVADNGPGIRTEDQRFIFEKFRQSGDAMTDKPPGTGLGLPISRQIIEHLGGRLWVESRLGCGATFIFELPIARVRASAEVVPGDADAG